MTRRTWQDRAEILFKILFLTVGFLQYSSLTFGKPIISWVQWPMLGLGAVLVILRLLHAKEYTATPGIWLLLAFAVAFGISSVLNLRYGWYENVRFLAFLGFQITLLYPYSRKSDPSVSLHHWEISAWVFLLGTFVLSLLSFVFLFTGRAEMFVCTEGPTYYIGFWWGRLFGAYWDPNIAAVMAVMACLLSVAMMIRYRSAILRIVLGLNLVLQIFYIELSDARSGKVALFVAAGMMAFLCALRLLEKTKLGVRVFFAAAGALLVAVTSVVLLMAGGRAYNIAVAQLSPSSDVAVEETPAPNDPNASVEETPAPNDPSVVEGKPSLPLNPIGREEDIASDISNRRFDIWKSAVEIFKTKPVFGVSYANIIPYARENLPDTYILTNDHMVFSSMHNVVMDILVGQGLVGVVLFLAAAVWVLVSILRRTSAFFKSERFYEYAAAFSLVTTAVVSSMFMTELVYVITPLTLMFWISLGVLSHAVCAFSKKEERA